MATTVYTQVPQEARDKLNEALTSDGSTAAYYELPPNATELQDLISHRNMNAQIGEIFRSYYRYGLASHSDTLRDAKKILFYANAEVERLKRLQDTRVESSHFDPQGGGNAACAP